MRDSRSSNTAIEKTDGEEQVVTSVHIKTNNNLGNKLFSENKEIEPGGLLIIQPAGISSAPLKQSQVLHSELPSGLQDKDTKNTPNDANDPVMDRYLQERTRLADELVEDSRMRAVLSTLEETYHGGVVEEHDPDRITNATARRAIKEGRDVKGWYDVDDGSVHIYMPNVESAEDLVETYFHEVIAHRGVRELLGEDGFNEMLDALAEKLGREEVQKAITAWSSHPERGYNDVTTRREAMDEWIAYHAEKMDPGARRNVWEVIRDFFRKLFGVKSDKTAEEMVEALFRESAARKRKQRGSGRASERNGAVRMRLSEETDRNGYHFIKASDGSLSFGRIPSESGLQDGELRLVDGYHDAETDSGYGLAHIEAHHGEQIRKAGYKTISDFVEFVGKNYDTIRRGYTRTNQTNTYLLELSDQHNHTLFVELDKRDGYWAVNSGGIFRKGYSKNKAVVWTVPALGNDASTDVAQFGISSGERTESGNALSGNSTQATAYGKGTENIETYKNEARFREAAERGDVTAAADAAVAMRQGERTKEVRLRKMNGKQLKDGSQEVISPEDVRFRATKRGRETIEGWLAKREDLTDEDMQTFFEEIKGLDNKGSLAAGRWFANGRIRLPEDMPKVEQALKVAEIAKVDPLQYESPMTLIEAHSEVELKEKPIDPETVSTLHRAKSFESGLVIYDVEEGEASQENMREIVNTHFGKESSPWCLLQGDEKGHLTRESKKYWKHYGAYPKQVAFFNGKLVAFSANDSSKRTWWDRRDRASVDVRVFGGADSKVPGRKMDVSVSPDTGEEIIIRYFQRIQKGNFEIVKEWYGNGQLKSEESSHNEAGKGFYRSWYEDGQPWVEEETLRGHPFGRSREWYRGGHLRRDYSYRNGKPDGIFREWYPDGQLESEDVYRGGSLDRICRRWYPNGQLSEEYGIKAERLDGRYKKWDENGEKILDAEYTRGEMTRDYLNDAGGDDGVRFREGEAIEETNARFNRELEKLTQENADNVRLDLGFPSEALLSGGVAPHRILLYGNKIIKKSEGHVYDKSLLKDLPNALQHPIAVFNTHGVPGDRAVLTEIVHPEGNVIVALKIAKEGTTTLNIVSSAYGKDPINIERWIEKDYMTYGDKETTLRYIRSHRAPMASASGSEESFGRANVRNNLETGSGAEDPEVRFREASQRGDLVEAAEISRSLNEDKALDAGKEKVQEKIDQQRTNFADVKYPDLNSVTKVVENFENPKLPDTKPRETRFREAADRGDILAAADIARDGAIDEKVTRQYGEIPYGMEVNPEWDGEWYRPADVGGRSLADIVGLDPAPPMPEKFPDQTLAEWADEMMAYNDDPRVRLRTGGLGELPKTPEPPLITEEMSVHEVAELHRKYNEECRQFSEKAMAQMQALGKPLWVIYRGLMDANLPLERWQRVVSRMGIQIPEGADMYNALLREASQITTLRKTEVEPRVRRLTDLIKEVRADHTVDKVTDVSFVYEYEEMIADEETGERKVKKIRRAKGYDKVGLYLRAKDIVWSEQTGQVSRGREGFEENVRTCEGKQKVTPEAFIASFEDAVGKGRAEKLSAAVMISRICAA